MLAGDWRVMGAFWKLRAVYGKSAWLASRWLAVDGGRSQHYCGRLDCRLPLVAFWQHNANTNVSDYMLVLALCLVDFSQHLQSQHLHLALKQLNISTVKCCYPSHHCHLIFITFLQVIKTAEKEQQVKSYSNRQHFPRRLWCWRDKWH